MKETRLTAITGGIGSGKSVVSKVLAAMGFAVYDCDSRAKTIMNESAEIKRQIAVKVCAEAIGADGRIDRKCLRDRVFADKKALECLNGIVHGAVRADIAAWRKATPRSRLFVETAILYESGLDKMADDVWEVDAPPELRLERVMKRSGLEAAKVEEIMRAQAAHQPPARHPLTARLINDDVTPLLPQIEKLLAD